MINSVPPSRVAVYQSIHPSVNVSLPPSIHHRDRCQTEAVRGTSFHLQLSAGKEQGMMTDNMGSRRIHPHTHTRRHTRRGAYSMPTRLLAGFAMSFICILGSRRMHMQMPTMLIVIKGHLPLRVSASSSLLFFSSPLYLVLLVSLSLWLSLPVNLPHPLLFSNSSAADFSVFLVPLKGRM